MAESCTPAKGEPAKFTVEYTLGFVGVMAAVCVIVPEPSAFVAVNVIVQFVGV